MPMTGVYELKNDGHFSCWDMVGFPCDCLDTRMVIAYTCYAFKISDYSVQGWSDTQTTSTNLYLCSNENLLAVPLLVAWTISDDKCLKLNGRGPFYSSDIQLDSGTI
ncbi:hypothetical protein VNO78_06284 [Psophocarpus tetragonolobus]|uniref:Uncharacterized protein n=1 Tax=Psophocarpus tetragonolobus TaxID=3891 RepID=A0AAN9T121_PSOTE